MQRRGACAPRARTERWSASRASFKSARSQTAPNVRPTPA
eukprot:XP_001707058.1 Hypothetical protein GL50803_39235 [Giardia lamblia ATCC 50803]